MPDYPAWVRRVIRHRRGEEDRAGWKWITVTLLILTTPDIQLTQRRRDPPHQSSTDSPGGAGGIC